MQKKKKKHLQNFAVSQNKDMNTKLITIKTMVVVCFVIASIELTAQSNEFNNTVALKNGTELKNVKVEETYTITSSDGKTTVYKKEEVASIKQKDALPVGSENWSANLGYMSWEDAKAKCASQNMRLPSLDELKAAQASNVTDSWKKEGYLYWSTTQTENMLADPYLLYAFNGQIYSLNRYASSYVRCIK